MFYSKKKIFFLSKNSTEAKQKITGLTKPQIRKLAEVEVIQLGLFDQVNLWNLRVKIIPMKD